MKLPHVLLVGAGGSIGRRYQAVLRAIGARFTPFDPALPGWETDILPPCDRILIASPTDTHYDWIMTACFHKKDFLCEKPMDKDINRCGEIVKKVNEAGIHGYIVNNWEWALNPAAKSKYEILSYDYYSTGKDGLKWDCCQLIYLNPEVKLNDKSPLWNVRVQYRRDTPRMEYREIEISYISMIDHWLTQDGSALWTVEDGYKMTKAVINYNIRTHRLKYDGQKQDEDLCASAQ